MANETSMGWEYWLPYKKHSKESGKSGDSVENQPAPP